MLLRYRGSEGMLAWAFHRISGVAILAFLLLHVLDICLVGVERRTLYDEVLGFYATPLGIAHGVAPRRRASCTTRSTACGS